MESSGEATLAEPLAAALRQANRDRRAGRSLTHGLHSYPARMHPATARALIELMVGPAIDRARAGDAPQVLDPFCGSGTTLVEARFAGAAGFGIDANPLAVRIATAKTWTALRREREGLRKLAHRIADRSWAEAKAARRSGYEPPPHRKRKRGSELDEWFPKHVRREIEFLYTAIVGQKDEVAKLLSVPLSAVLYKVSLRASDTDRTKVERRIGRGAATRHFRERVDLWFEGLDELAGAHRAPIPKIIAGDARRLPRMRVDAVITSPPYPGTYDYTAHHDLRTIFLELDDRRFHEREIGSRRSMGKGGLTQWRADTKAWMSQASARLGKHKLMAVVVGDSFTGRGAVFADQELEKLAPAELELVARASQSRSKLGMGEQKAFGKRPKREHILLFRRQ
jgi:SAM-dependent methyltransferase